jgi:FG-GAP-like repeat/Bacterial Ig-like domain (group 3)
MTHSTIVARIRRKSSRTVSLSRMMPVLLSALALVAGPSAWAATTTTTTLFATPNTPSSGAVITMTAQVSSTSATVGGGTVTFTDTYNGVSEVLGTVQVESAISGNAGAAIFETEVGGVGTHQFVATYNGTSVFSSSASTVQSVNFLAPYLSATGLTSTATNPYTLTGTVSAFGPTAPTGSVTFTNTTSNVTLGTVPLDSASLVTGFAPYTNYPITNLNNGATGGTNAPAIGDFNGDGRLDYAIPTNAGPVLILLGKGDGTFSNGTTVNPQSGFVPTSVVVGDFNGDGKQDMAVLSATGGGTSGTAGSVDVFLGKGNGTFNPYVNYLVAPTASNSGSRILTTGDFNRDGYVDLVATNATLNTVAVLLGNGDGTFNAQTSYTVGAAPWNVVAGDLNNDGFLDLAVASDGSSSVSILQGNGDGTFKTFTAFNTSGSQVGSVALGDFNGDGWLDVATTAAPQNNAYILLNTKATAAPTFGAATSFPLTPGPYYLTVGDFNRDGKLDLIAAINGTGATAVGVLLGNGAGRFGTATYYQVGGASIFANAADINGDDQVDLTALTYNGLSVLLSGEAETAALSNVVISGCNTQSVTATYSGDGSYGQSTSAALTFPPKKQTTGLVLTVTPQNGVTGQQFTLQATLSPYTYGSTTTNGETVTFYYGGSPIGTGTLSSGVATFVVSTNATGGGNVTASYPGDCAFTASNSNSVPVTIKQASVITWNNPAAITYGTPLTSTQLNATDNVAGSFAYSPASGTILPAGANTLTATFTPTDSSYGVQTATVTIQVSKQNTVITWPTPTPITYGTPLSGFQLDATATSGTTAVNLAPYYNVSGIYDPGQTYSTGGFDNDGYSYSSKTLSGSVVFNGLTFNLGPVNAPDAVYGTGTAIPLPAGKFSTLYVLGAMVNNIGAGQTFTVTYTDGTTTVLNQNMSDWFNAAGWPGESVINCSEKRNFSDGSQQADSVCLYGYTITLDPTKIVKNVSIPNTRNIVILAMNLASPAIPGTFVYDPPAGTVEPVGTDVLSVTFTPTDSTDYGPSTGTVNLVVTNAVTPIVTPTISWAPNPLANIPYGTLLGPTQLDAVAMGTPRPTPVTPTSQLVPLSTSTDGTAYNLAGFDTAGGTYSYQQLNNGSVQFAGTTFTLGQPNVPNSITNGAVYSLGAAQGNYSTLYLIGAATTTGQTKQPFILTYADGGNPVSETLDISSWAQSAGYSDETIVAKTKYKNTQGGGQVTGTFDLYGYTLPVDPTRTLVSVSVPNTRNVVIMALGFGSNTQVVVPGTYAYNPPSGTLLSVGTHTLNVTFTPSNTTGYTSASATNTITVVKATPIITWPTPAAIAVGTPLSSTQLNAVASINGTTLAGTYKYTPPAGTVLSAGTHTLTVLFTPNDSTDYTTATGTVQIVVGTTGSTTVGGSPLYASSDCCYFSQPTPYTVTLSGSSAPPTGTVNVTFAGHTLASGTLVPGSGATSSVLLYLSSIYFVPGNNTATINYLGDTNYVPSSNTAIVPLENPAISWNPTSFPGGTSTVRIPYTFVVAGSIKFNFNPSGGSIGDFTNNSTLSSCASGVQETAGMTCLLYVPFVPQLPGIRKGVVEVDFTDTNNVAEPILYLFLSGLGAAPQIQLGSATQVTLNSTFNLPQSVAFKPTDTANATLYAADSGLGLIDTLASSTPGALTRWNTANTRNLAYPTDLIFDAFGNLIVPDANAPGIFKYDPTLAASTLSTGAITVGSPTAGKVDFGGNLYIADGGNSPKIVEIPGETYASYTPSTLLSGSTVSYPQMLAIDNSGNNLYVGDGDLQTIQQVSLNGGTNSMLSLTPCDTTVTTCTLYEPSGMAFDPNNDMFITDTARVIMVPANHASGGKTTQLPVTGLIAPTNIALDGAGNVYVSDLNTRVIKLQVNSGALTINPLNTTVTTTITNTGSLNLTISSMTLGHGAASSFSLGTNTCIATIAPGGTCSVAIKYSNASGAATDTLTILSNAYAPGGVTIKLTN